MSRWVPLALALAACGETPVDPAVVETREVTIGPLTIPAGGEDTGCVILDLGNAEPAMLRTIETHLTQGTHHVIVSRSSVAPTGEPAPCGAFSGGGVAADNPLLFIAQSPEAALAYPDGAGLPIEAHQAIHLEMHYFNSQPAGDLEISGTVELGLADRDADLRPVNLMFTGDLALSIPAGTQLTQESFFDLPDGAALFAASAHTHRWGTHATVELADGSTDPAPRLLHASDDWAERPLDVFDAIDVIASHRLKLTCSWDNQSDQDVSFGLSATDEMCFLWAYYTAP